MVVRIVIKDFGHLPFLFMELPTVPFFHTPPVPSLRPLAFALSLFLHGFLGVLVWAAGAMPVTEKAPSRAAQRYTRLITLVPRPDLSVMAEAIPPRIPVPARSQASEPAASGEPVSEAAKGVQSKAEPFRTLPVEAKKIPRSTNDLLIQPELPKDLAADNSRAPDMLLLNELMNRKRTLLQPPPVEAKPRIPAKIELSDEAPRLGLDPNGLMAQSKMPNAVTRLAPAAGKFPISIPEADAPPQNMASVGGVGKDLPNIVSMPTQIVPRFGFTALPSTESSPAAALGPSAKNGAEQGGAKSGNGSAAETGGPSASVPPSGTAGPPGPSRVAAPMPKPIRMEHPRNGQYDVAVTLSASALPGAAGLLKGRPVYTVYLAVGTSKDWVLQYAPNDGASVGPRNGMVVTLDQPAPMTAPYAFVILRPPVARISGGARYGFVHGLINATGRFENMSAVGPAAFEDSREILQTLKDWEFRPATKDGVPVAVEFLLCIPNPAIASRRIHPDTFQLLAELAGLVNGLPSFQRVAE